MFVFPAFNSNYKTRKRTFNCCQNCRVKRVKCEITSTDYESVGCKTCRKHNWTCSLIRRPEHNEGRVPGPGDLLAQEEGLIESGSRPSEVPQLPMNSEIIIKEEPGLAELQGISQTQNQGHIPGQISPLSRENSDSSKTTFRTTPSPIRMITPQYLKETFNFNISGQDSVSTYQLIYHGHPKAIIASASDDQSIWHESGVYIKVKNDDDSKNDSKSYKVRNFGKSGKEKQFYIKNDKIYNFLLSINAFTLSSSEYPLDNFDIKSLVELYFFKINSIFPLVHEKKFWDDFFAEKAQNVLVYAIVLVISRDKMAEPILRRVFGKISNSSTTDFQTNLQSFMTDLEYKIRQILLILPQLGDDDKFTRLVVSMLLSLHFNFDKMGNEQSSHDLTDAINLGVVLGIHLKRLSSKIDPVHAEYTTNLWWCCYIFDRFNGLFNQRNLFIRQDDFNVDLPYKNINLLKLVQLARSLENMAFAIFQPFNDTTVNSSASGAGAKTNPKNLKSVNPRYNTFNIDEFQRIEFELCDLEKSSSRTIYDSNGGRGGGFDYVNNTIHFLSRLVNNVVIIGSQKAKYDNPSIPKSIPDENAFRASQNIVRYVKEMQDDYVINVPMVPWCISLAMAISLKRKSKEYLKGGPSSEDNKHEGSGIFELEAFLEELQKFSSTWWFVDEMYRLTKDFTDKLATKSIRRAKRRKSSASVQNGSALKNQKLGTLNHPVKWDSSNNIINQTLPEVQPPIPQASSSKADTIPSIQNILYSDPVLPKLTPNENRFQSPTESGNVNASPSANTVSSNDLDHYDQYFDSMQIDIFNYDFFKDVPNAINLLS